MSKTDKDAPWWVRHRPFVPHHHPSCELGRLQHTWIVGVRLYHVVARSTLTWSAHRASRAGLSPVESCTLPVRARPYHPTANAHRRHTPMRCHWEPMWTYERYRPSRIERRTQWFGPDRAAVRDACRRAAAEYRASGDVDAEVPAWDHRHGPRKGYWD